MIEFVKGRLIEKYPTHAVVDCNGLGYFLNISLNTFSKLSDEENVLIYTHLVVREDAHLLYGFFDKVEREVFRLLIQVNGVGVNTARIILSTLTPDQVEAAIASEDVNLLKSVKGIGAKTAQRVIIDLKDKVGAVISTETGEVFESTNAKFEATSALKVLGFADKQINNVLDKLLKNEPGLGVEELIKSALKML
jgi:holliday junction DNA helicase RuvA